MTNNDELAIKLKQTAQLVHDNEQISNYGKLEAWKVRFRHTASPANIISLLAERDADKKRIAELGRDVDAANARVDTKCAQLCNQDEEIEMLRLRIAELEARMVSVKLPPKVDSSNLPFAAHTWNSCIDEVTKRLAAAGIKLEVGE